jgi:acyl-CoA thioester hydrolase
MENIPGTYSYHVKWAELDPYGHVRQSAYGDYCTDARFRFLSEHGFTPAWFLGHGLGPVIQTDSNRYLREISAGDTVSVSVELAGMSEDGTNWRVSQRVYKGNGKLAMTSIVEGTWLDLKLRRAVVPPDDVLALFRSLPQPDDFEVLPSVLRRRG